MLVAGHKTLREKWEALKDLEKRMSNKDVAAKYGNMVYQRILCQLGSRTKENI